MADKLGLALDDEPHELILGSSFKSNNVAFHSIRYDFKPASVDTTKMSAVEVGENNSITVTVPHVEGSGTAHTVYKGNKRPCQKECVLVIDHNTGEILLEKLANTMQLKKIRQDGSSKVLQARPITPVEQLKLVKEHKSTPVSHKEHKMSPAQPKSPVQPKSQGGGDMATLSSSDSGSSSDSNDSGNSSSDEEDFKNIKETRAEPVETPVPVQQSTGFSTNLNLLGHDLMLSDSGSDSDD